MPAWSPSAPRLWPGLSVDDPEDAFQLVRMERRRHRIRPAEAGRRSQHDRPVRRPPHHPRLPDLKGAPGGRGAPADDPSKDAIVIVEAGDLQRSNPLRTACEKARTALAVPCYGDAARDLTTIIDEMVRAAGKTIDRASRDHLAGLLGGDRQTSRREIEKLLLYVGSDPAIGPDHIDAVVGDTAQREQAMLIDAVFSGKLPVLDLAQAKLAGEGLDPGVMLGAVLRHALALLKARQGVDAGRSARDMVAAMRLPYPRIATTEAALSNWTTAKLMEAVTLLGNATLAARRDGDLGRAGATRALWTLARLGRAAGRGE